LFPPSRPDSFRPLFIKEAAMRRFVLAAGCLTVAALLASCSVSGVGASAGGTLQSGRSIEVTSDRSFRTILCKAVGTDTESVKLGTFGGHKVLIKPASIDLDGQTVATISETTRDVSVAEENGRLVITADGVAVFETEF